MKYQVVVERFQRFYTELEVVASDADEAAALAEDEAEYGPGILWIQDEDWSDAQAYSVYPLTEESEDA